VTVMTELQQVKAISKARDLDEKRHLERRRDTLVLILRHLVDNGYTASYERLSTECNLSLGKVDVADNVDLLRVVQEFEEGYEAKYGRRPKITRRLVASVDPEVHAPARALPQRHLSAGANSSSSSSSSAAPSPSAAQPPPGVLSGGMLCPGPATGALPAVVRGPAGGSALEGPPVR
ncbi:hypothetical protein QJQ45_022946, partial [Haematococcus lacustris]